MAKKESFDFSDWDDFEDFGDFEDGTGEGNFKSTTKVGKAREAVGALTGGFVSGVKDSLFSRGFYQSVVGEALPKEYTIALDDTLDVKDSVTDLYDSAVNEADKISDKLTKGVKPIVDKYGDKLPRRMARPLKKWTQNVRSTSAWTPENKDELESVAALNDIFNKREQSRSARKTSIESTVQSGLARGNMDLTSRLLGQQQQLVAYQDQIDAVWKRKTLELQYKQFFVQRKSLDSQQQLLAISKEAFTSITKNTALPDFVKANKSEVGGRMLTEKLYGAAINQFSSLPKNLVRKLTNNVNKKLKESSKNMQESLLDGLTSIYDNLEDAEDIGEQLGQRGSVQQSGELGGSLASGSIARFIGKKIKKKYGDNQKVKDGATILSAGSKRIPKIFGELVRSQDTGSNFLDMLLEFADAEKEIGQRRPTVMKNHVDELDKGAHFDLLTKKSITEIIPGFLTRIHHEIHSLRTGDDSASMVQFDHEKGVFSDAKTINKKLRDNILGSYNKQVVATSHKELIEALGMNGDANGKGKLDEQTQNAFLKQFSVAALDNKDFTLRSMLDGSNNDLTKEQQTAFTEFLFDNFDMLVDEEDQNASFLERIKQGIVNQKGDTIAAHAAQKKIGEAADSLQNRLSNPSGLLTQHASRGNIAGALDLNIMDEQNGNYVLNSSRYIDELMSGGVGSTDSSGDYDPVAEAAEEAAKKDTAASKVAKDIANRTRKIMGNPKVEEAIDKITDLADTAKNSVNDSKAAAKVDKLLQTATAALEEKDVTAKIQEDKTRLKEMGGTVKATAQLTQEDPKGVLEEAKKQAASLVDEAHLKALLIIDQAHAKSTPIIDDAKKTAEEMKAAAVKQIEETKVTLANTTKEDVAAKVTELKTNTVNKANETKTTLSNTTKEDVTNKIDEVSKNVRGVTTSKINDFKKMFTGDKLTELKGKFGQNDLIIKAINYVKVKTGKLDVTAGDITRLYGEDSDFRALMDLVNEEVANLDMKGKFANVKSEVTQNATILAVLKRIESVLPKKEDKDVNSDTPKQDDDSDDTQRKNESTLQWHARIALKSFGYHHPDPNDPSSGPPKNGLIGKAKAIFTNAKGAVQQATVKDHDEAEDYADSFINDNDLDDKDGKVKESLMRNFFESKFGSSEVLDKLRKSGELASGAMARGKRSIDTLRSKKVSSKVGDAVGLLFELSKYGAKAGEVMTRPHRAALKMIPWGLKKIMALVIDTKNFQHIQHALWLPGEKEPRLLKTGLMNGRYINGDGKVIVVPKDIVGNIYDAMHTPEELIMTPAEYKVGLFDSTGKLIYKPDGFIKKVAKGIVTLPFKIAKKAVKFTGKVLMGYLKVTTKPATWMIKKIMSEKSIDPKLHTELMHLGLTDQTNAKLDNIGAILDDRMDGGKQKFNDKDGDGKRDGGIDDVKEKRETVKKVRKDKKEGMLSRLFKGKKKKKDETEEEKDGLDLMGMLSGKGKMFGKLAGLAKNPWVLGGVAVASMLGWEGLSDKRKSDDPDDIANQLLPDTMKDSKAARIGVRVSETVLNTLLLPVKSHLKGIVSIGKGVKKAAAWADRKAGRMSDGLSRILGGALGKTTGFLFGRGARKWVDRLMGVENVNPLYRFRMAQYGFKYNDKLGTEAILKFEDDILQSLIPATDTSPAKIHKDITIEQSAAYFGVSINDESDMEEWVTWYANRFRPVFLSNVTMMQRLGFDGKELHAVDSTMGKTEKLDFIAKINFFRDINNPYDCNYSPMSSEWKLSISDKREVEDIRKEQISEIERMSENKKEIAKAKARTAKIEKTKKDKALAANKNIKAVAKNDINAKIDSISAKSIFTANKTTPSVNEIQDQKNTEGYGFGGAGAGGSTAKVTKPKEKTPEEIREVKELKAAQVDKHGAVGEMFSALGGLVISKAQASSFIPEMEYGGANMPLPGGKPKPKTPGLPESTIGATVLDSSLAKAAGTSTVVNKVAPSGAVTTATAPVVTKTPVDRVLEAKAKISGAESEAPELGYTIVPGQSTLSYVAPVVMVADRKNGADLLGPVEKPIKAARYARESASVKPNGKAASNITNALVKAGYIFTAPARACDFPIKALPSIDYVKIDTKTKIQAGDIVVYSSFKKNPNGHIQIYDGANWISDHMQKDINPYIDKSDLTYTLWRGLEFSQKSSLSAGDPTAMRDLVKDPAVIKKLDPSTPSAERNKEKNNERGKIGKAWDKVKDTTSSIWDSLKDKSGSIYDKIKGFFTSDNAPAGTAAGDFGAGGVDGSSPNDGVVADMSTDQKKWQLGVYNAFKNTGFSEMQARIMTAEIGRENSYNPTWLFGAHNDPHRGKNLGMLSWQGDRRLKLVPFLKQAGVLTAGGKIIPSQVALDAMARFILWEMKNTHKKVGSEFLSQPNISYAAGVRMIGKRYILWRIDDPKYASKGAKSRDGFYNMLVRQLKDGSSTVAATPKPTATQAAFASVTAAQTKPVAASKTGVGSGVLKPFVPTANLDFGMGSSFTAKVGNKPPLPAMPGATTPFGTVPVLPGRVSVATDTKVANARLTERYEREKAARIKKEAEDKIRNDAITAKSRAKLSKAMGTPTAAELSIEAALKKKKDAELKAAQVKDKAAAGSNVLLPPDTAPGAAPGVALTSAPWIAVARSQLGTNKTQHPAKIREYHLIGSGSAHGAHIAYCASFVGWCLIKAGLKSSNSAGAESYSRYGKKLTKDNIPFGAILFIKYKSGNHVTFCLKDNGNSVTTIGGNQGKRIAGKRDGGWVTESTATKGEIVAVTYPDGFTPGMANSAVAGGGAGMSISSVPYAPAKMAYNDNKDKDIERLASVAAAGAMDKHDSGYRIVKGKSRLALATAAVVNPKRPKPTNPEVNKTATAEEVAKAEIPKVKTPTVAPLKMTYNTSPGAAVTKSLMGNGFMPGTDWSLPDNLTADGTVPIYTEEPKGTYNTPVFIQSSNPKDKYHTVYVSDENAEKAKDYNKGKGKSKNIPKGTPSTDKYDTSYFGMGQIEEVKPDVRVSAIEPYQTTYIGGPLHKEPTRPDGMTATQRAQAVTAEAHDPNYKSTRIRPNPSPIATTVDKKTESTLANIEKELKIQKEVNKNLTQKMAESEARKSNDDLASSTQTLKESLYVQKQMLERLSSMDIHLDAISRGQRTRNITESSNTTATPKETTPVNKPATPNHQVKRPGKGEPMSMSKLA